jgi:hypothetical protein
MSSIAFRVKHVFRRLHKVTESNVYSGEVKMFTMWQQAFPDEEAMTTVQFLGHHVVRDIKLLDKKIQSSGKIHDDDKLEYKNVTTGLLTCVSSLLHPVNSLKQYFSKTVLSQIGGIDTALSLEFPDPTFTTDQIDEYISDFEVLLAELNETKNLDVDIRICLREQINALLWVLKNSDTVSMEAIQEATASVLTFTNTLTKSETIVKHKIFDKIYSKIRSLAEFAYQMYLLDGTFHNMVQVTHDIGEGIKQLAPPCL